MRNKYQVTHQPPGGNVTNISDCIVFQESEGIRSDADSFSFSIKYPTILNFNDGDNIKIYLGSGNSILTLVMDGFVKEITINEDIDRKVATVSGQNRLEIFLNAPYPAKYAYTGTNNNSAKAIKNLIQSTNFKWINSKYKPYITAELKSLGGNIDDTVSLDTFPAPGYFRVDTPAFQLIEELSSTTWTGRSDLGNFIFYLDASNNFHWEPSSTTVTNTIGQGKWLSIKVNKSVYDVINFAIIDAGFDFNGKPIKTYAFNNNGQIKGFRGKYFTAHEISENMKDPESYPGTYGYGSRDIDGNTNNTTFRNKVKAAAKAKGEEITGTFGQPRFKVNLHMRGTTEYNKGQIYTIQYNGIFRNTTDALVSQINLRLRQVTHIFNSKGWFTDLEFIQDEITLMGSGYS